MSKCATKFCRGRASVSGKSPYCSKCRSRRFREKHPITAAFMNLKASANRRGIEFTITLEYFTAFWKENDLDGNYGCKAGDLTVDRKNETLGYIPGNLQALTNSENVRKRWVPYFRALHADEIREAENAVKMAYPGI